MFTGPIFAVAPDAAHGQGATIPAVTRRLALFTASAAALAASVGLLAGPAAAAPSCKTAAQPSPRATGGQKAPKKSLDAKKAYDVTFETNCGSFTVRLDVKRAPNIAASIVSLVKAGFYNKTVFHRIVPGFVIQGGDPTATGTGGPGYSVVDSPPKDLKYTLGLVAMAKTQTEAPGTSGSQFFVVTGQDVGLPPDYGLVGRVTKGLDVVQLIGTLGNAEQQPTRIVQIVRATVKNP